MAILRGVGGIVALLAFAWLLSSNRRQFPWKIVIGGIALQWLLALFVLKTATGDAVFSFLAMLVKAVLDAAGAGSDFVFKMVAGGETPWFLNVGVIILSTITFMSTLASIGYYFGILQRVVRAMAWVMRKSMGVTGAESLAAAANVFLGQTEAPLLVRPYIPTMTRSELMALMTGGFATVAAGVLAVYVNLLGGNDEALRLEITRHLLTACLMSAPGAFVIAKVMVPPTPGGGSDAAELDDRAVVMGSNLLDAITEGASQGMKLAINVIAMLIAFVALIHLIDALLTWFGALSFMQPAVGWLGLKQLTLGGLLGLVFQPVALVMGVDLGESRSVASFIGKAMTTNEIIAYEGLSDMMSKGAISKRAALLTTYALCGFANIGSIGIQIGGISPMAPTRRLELAELAPRAMFGGAMACWMTAAIAGILI